MIILVYYVSNINEDLALFQATKNDSSGGFNITNALSSSIPRPGISRRVAPVDTPKDCGD
jgi:hypothetical protein